MSVASEVVEKKARQPKAKVISLNQSSRNVRRSEVIVGNKQQLQEIEEARLVAAYAAADVHAKAAAEHRETARKALIAWMDETGHKLARSAGFLVTKKDVERRSLDSKRIASEMGEAWCAERSKISVSPTLSVTALQE